MNKNRRYFRVVLFVLFLCVTALTVPSCNSSKGSTHRPTRYSKNRTKYNPHWNSTTSQHTTYYIKKHYRKQAPSKPKTQNKKHKH